MHTSPITSARNAGADLNDHAASLLGGLAFPDDFQPVEAYGVLMDGAEPADQLAYARASETADLPTAHPDQFRYLLPVVLPDHHRPVWCVATVGFDGAGRFMVDDAWIFHPRRSARKVKDGPDFFRVRAETIGWHYDELVARVAEIRDGRSHPSAASTLPPAAPLPSMPVAFAIRRASIGHHAA